MKRFLKVEYSSPVKDPDLEHKIQDFFSDLGFEQVGQRLYKRPFSKSSFILTHIEFRERWDYEDLEEEEVQTQRPHVAFEKGEKDVRKESEKTEE